MICQGIEMEKQMVEIELSKEAHPEFGMMGKLTFGNGSNIYIFNKGWHLKYPDDKTGLTIPWSEINLAIEKSLELGYKNKEINENSKVK